MSTSTSAAGRKRDPRVDDAVKETALRLYGEQGWLGFSLNAIAREARVGKPAVYRRWSTREDLLADALTQMSFPRPRLLGSLEEELHDLAHQLADWWLEGSGRITLLLTLETTTFPELRVVYDTVVRRPSLAAGVALVEQAIERGELPADTERFMIAELLSGAILTHFVFTWDRDEDAPAGLHAYVDALADRILRAFAPASG